MLDFTKMLPNSHSGLLGSLKFGAGLRYLPYTSETKLVSTFSSIAMIDIQSFHMLG